MNPVAHPLRGPIAAPSLLSADFTRLGEALRIIDPALDWLHCDVMDFRFVPNLTFGPLVVAAARRVTPALLDVHLMVERPETMLRAFREAGADQMTVHLEACADARAVLRAVHDTGARAGLSIKPGTPFSAAEAYLADIDVLLVMTVEPGFGGQAFMPAMLDKVRAARAARGSGAGAFLIEVDGGIGPGTAAAARAAGADVFVAGNAVFGQPDSAAALEALRREIGR